MSTKLQIAGLNKSGMSRRDLLALGTAAATAPFFSNKAFAATPDAAPVHGLSAFGDLKYGPDFHHFDYVNPDAPKGGIFNFSVPNWTLNQNPLTFNTLNFLVLRGDAPPRMEMCFDSLMVRALDEPDTLYGLLAQSVTVLNDGNSFSFRLRPQARFHDGSPVRAEDVAFSFNLYKEKGHPSLVVSLRHMTEAVAEDTHLFRVGFSGRQSARAILDIASFPIVSKAFFSANPFDASQLNAPLGSGPYKVGLVRAGEVIEYERVADYWGQDLPVNRGHYNFDRIRIEFFRNRDAGFQAFKKGEVTFRQEFTARNWATGYDFPAMTQGKVVKREFPGDRTPSMQAHAVNQRRERFRDPRVREAMALCFDFEWINRNLFHDSYKRSNSLFERSPYRAEGLPSPQELALLEPLRDGLPQTAFGQAVALPGSDGSGRDRKLLGKALELLSQAGWQRKGGMLENEKGERLVAEILVQEEGIARVDAPWVENMRAVGIDASIRMVDAAQYQARQNDFDFDLILIALSFPPTPTYEGIENLFHSRNASLPGSRNLPGTVDPAIDTLVEAVGRAQDRDQLTTAMRALDRVVRARWDWIPAYHLANHRAAFWDMFGYKEPKPDYGFPVEALWWFDDKKAKAIGKF